MHSSNSSAPYARLTQWVLAVLFGILLAPMAGYADTPLEQREQVIRGLGQAVDESGGHYLRGGPADKLPGQVSEITELRIAQQHGLGYLPLMIARQQGLIEKYARTLGHPGLRVIWSRYPSGHAMNDALASGFLDIGSGGLGPFIRLWDQTREREHIQGLSALSSMPLFLNTASPRVKTLYDLNHRDRIALPAQQDSIQAVLLRMAVVRDFGIEHHAALDGITTSMAHPQAMRSLLRGEQGITAHFASPPFQYQELRETRVKRLLSSYELFNGPLTFSALWTRNSFVEENPITVQALLDALSEAITLIETDRRKAAGIYLLHSDSNQPAADIQAILGDPQVRFTLIPRNTLNLARFMHATGAIHRSPEELSELFPDPRYTRGGS